MSAPPDQISERIARICDGVDAWLNNEDGILDITVDRTATEGLFPRHDVMHMLKQVSATVTPEALQGWVDRVCKVQQAGKADQVDKVGKADQVDMVNQADSEISSGSIHAQSLHMPKVLCLHAGNLPLVGLQDIIATLLSGAVYYGKLSRRDPWLADGLLRVLRKRLPDQLGGWASRLEEVGKVGADKVLFAGAESSVEEVKQRIHELGLASDQTHFLPRTARFSMAWLDEKDFQSDNVRLSKHLIEAMMRYEGRGCRSLAVVVARRSLSEFSGSLIDAAEVFVRRNRPSHYRKPGVSYWRSYLKSTGKEVYDIGSQIISDDHELIGREDVICWLTGDEEDVVRLARQFGPQLQQVYVYAGREALSQKGVRSLSDVPEIRLEPLSNAQSPPIDWQPDGIDVLEWLWDA